MKTSIGYFKIIVFFSFLILLVSCHQLTDQPPTRPAAFATTWLHLSTENRTIPSPGPSTEQTASLVFDVDRDGINDFVVASRQTGPSVLLYRRCESGWTKSIIDNDFLPIEAGGAVSDIDGDGDPDIVFGGDYMSNRVWWWENPFPELDAAVPWKRREIKNSGAAKHHDQIFGDFDGDGKTELVFWNQDADRLFIADLPDDPRNTEPWPIEAIFTNVGPSEGLAGADIDLDGKLDIVGGGYWFKHNEGMDFTPHVIDKEQAFGRVAVGQLKEGNRPEVVFVVGDGVGRLKWYEWRDGSWFGHDLLEYDVDHGHSLEIADVNGDGYLDIFCGEMRLNGANEDAKIWVFLGDGKGKFTETLIARGFGIHESKIADLDGDGDMDILGKPYNWDTPRLDIWLNGNKKALDRWKRHLIDADKPWRSMFIASADLDGDERLDIITGGWWYKNSGDIENRWSRHTIGLPLRNMAAVSDFDEDGDADILGTAGEGSDSNNNFFWARNDGAAQFEILSNISKGDGDFLQGVSVERFNRQGPIEVALSWHEGGKGVQTLTVPDRSSLDIWAWQKIYPESQNECLSAGDIDGDGDIDLLLGTRWLRNEGSSWRIFEIADSRGEPDRNRLVDINRDGRLDAVVGYEINKLAWYEQGNSVTSRWKEHIISKDIVRPMSLDAADLDQDGDIDLVVGEHNLSKPTKSRLYIVENVDSKEDNWNRHLVYEGDEHHDGARLVDIDKDGDLDIVSIGWSHSRVVLYGNKALQRPVRE